MLNPNVEKEPNGEDSRQGQNGGPAEGTSSFDESHVEWQ